MLTSHRFTQSALHLKETSTKGTKGLTASPQENIITESAHESIEKLPEMEESLIESIFPFQSNLRSQIFRSDIVELHSFAYNNFRYSLSGIPSEQTRSVNKFHPFTQMHIMWYQKLHYLPKFIRVWSRKNFIDFPPLHDMTDV